LIILGALLATSAAYYALVERRADPDIFWHIANGREMVETHSIPQQDGMSWYGIERNLQTSTQEWLYDLVIYFLYHIGGFGLVYAFTAMLSGALFVALYALVRIRTGSLYAAVVVAVLAIAGSMPVIAPRPTMVSALLLVVMAVLLERRWWLASLPVIVLVANMHGGVFPMFLVALTYYAYREKPWLTMAAAASVAVNPQTTALWRFPFQGTFGEITAMIQEWQPASLGNDPFLFMALIALVLAVRNKRIPLDTGLFALALSCLALIGLRYGVYVYILAIPLLAPYVLATTPGLQDERNIMTTLREGTPAPAWLKGILISELVLGTVVVLALGLSTPIDVHDGWPRDAVRYIQENRIDRVFNYYDDGGYLVFHGVPTLIDGRAIQFGPLFNKGEDLIFRYMEVVGLETDHRQFIHNLGIRYVLLPKELGFYRVLLVDPKFTTIYEDATHVLMEFGPVASS
jgi:hypothetical protein